MVRKKNLATIAGLVSGLALATAAFANPIMPGFDSNTLAANDDLSVSTKVSTGFDMNFFGTTYDGVFVNNNGNVTFSHTESEYTPTGLTGPLGQAIIAPFFADVDTRPNNSALMSYGTGTSFGKNAFGVNWPGVGYYDTHEDLLNTFQLLLVDRSDVNSGDFDIYFNYGSMTWETGDASDGLNGFGGSCAVAGYSNGTGDSGTYRQLPGSAQCGELIDGGLYALSTSTNDNVTGQFLFEVRNGQVTPPSPPQAVPEPGMLALGIISLAGLGLARRRHSRR